MKKIGVLTASKQGRMFVLIIFGLRKYFIEKNTSNYSPSVKDSLRIIKALIEKAPLYLIINNLFI